MVGGEQTVPPLDPKTEKPRELELDSASHLAPDRLTDDNKSPRIPVPPIGMVCTLSYTINSSSHNITLFTRLRINVSPVTVSTGYSSFSFVVVQLGNSLGLPHNIRDMIHQRDCVYRYYGIPPVSFSLALFAVESQKQQKGKKVQLSCWSILLL